MLQKIYSSSSESDEDIVIAMVSVPLDNQPSNSGEEVIEPSISIDAQHQEEAIELHVWLDQCNDPGEEASDHNGCSQYYPVFKCGHYSSKP